LKSPSKLTILKTLDSVSTPVPSCKINKLSSFKIVELVASRTNLSSSVPTNKLLSFVSLTEATTIVVFLFSVFVNDNSKSSPDTSNSVLAPALTSPYPSKLNPNFVKKGSFN
jgi:hypothetical protein